jgi:hypothetical protein
VVGDARRETGRGARGDEHLVESLFSGFTALAGLLVLGETLSGPRWFGIACICGATVVAISSTGPAGNAGAPAPGTDVRGAAPDR